jgi:hypothetical protein
MIDSLDRILHRGAKVDVTRGCLCLSPVAHHGSRKRLLVGGLGLGSRKRALSPHCTSLENPQDIQHPKGQGLGQEAQEKRAEYFALAAGRASGESNPGSRV